MCVNRAVTNGLQEYKHIILFRDKIDGSLRGTLLVNIERRSHESMKYTFIKASDCGLPERGNTEA